MESLARENVGITHKPHSQFNYRFDLVTIGLTIFLC